MACEIPSYEIEAKAALQASISEPAVRYAIMSLRTLLHSRRREGSECKEFYHGLEQYNKAIASLVNKLSEADCGAVRLTLLCCQIFISIETLQRHHTTAVQHFIRGLSIMHNYNVRPAFDSMGNLVPSKYSDLPLVDVFAIKLLMHHPPMQGGSKISSTGGDDGGSKAVLSHLRGSLLLISESVLELLHKISSIRSKDEGVALLVEKLALLSRLDDWQTKALAFFASQCIAISKSADACYLLLFHAALKLVTRLSLTIPQEHAVAVAQAFGGFEFEEILSISKLSNTCQGYYKKAEAAPSGRPARWS
jgi:hypothetical protein